MSIDYYVFTKNLDNFSTEAFFRYARTLGVDLRTEEPFAISEAEGFQPFLLNVHFIDTVSRDETFLSGFEMYITPYTYVPAPPVKPTFLQKLLGRIPAPEEPTPFSRAVADAKHEIFINCASTDSFEILLAYILAAYLCRECGGVLDDPQTGAFYDVPKYIENEIENIKEELNREAENGELCTHKPQ